MKLILFFSLLIPIFIQAQNKVWISGNVVNDTTTMFFAPDEKQKENSQSFRLDKRGNFSGSFVVNKPSQVSLFLGPTIINVFLSPNDSLQILNIEKQTATVFMYASGRFKNSVEGKKPIFVGRGAKINDFLYDNSLLGRDSLTEKGIFKSFSEEQYFDFLDGLSAETWHRYQATQDTTNKVQTLFVLASIRGQSYFRKLGFYGYDKRFDSQIKATILQDDEARNTPLYWASLRDYFHTGVIKTGDEYWEEKAEKIANELKNLPKTSEKLLSEHLLMMILFSEDFQKTETAIKRFAVNFSDTQKYKELMVKMEERKLSKPLLVDNVFPAIPFLNTQKDTISMAQFKGKPTTILFWNTWCDSCQIAVEKFCQQAVNQKSKNQNWLAVCVNNNQSTWEEAILNLPKIPQLQHLYILRKDEAVIRAVMSTRNFPERATILFLDADGKVKALPEKFEESKLKN